MNEDRLSLGLWLILFAWTALPLLFLLVYLVFGQPHLVWNYSYRPDGMQGRFFTRCTYINYRAAPTTISPLDGKCPLIRFIKV